jgi:hypothetical protein
VISEHAHEYIVSAESSSLMHRQGCADRVGVKFILIAQI